MMFNSHIIGYVVLPGVLVIVIGPWRRGVVNIALTDQVFDSCYY